VIKNRRVLPQGSNDVRRALLAAGGIAILSSPSIAETPCENAARVDMEQLASSILAAGLCKGVQFHGDNVLASVAATIVLIAAVRMSTCSAVAMAEVPSFDHCAAE
jgi:hypothetical protein